MPATALIVGAGSGISASFARCLHRKGYQVALAARTPENIKTLLPKSAQAHMHVTRRSPIRSRDLFAELDTAG